MLTKQLTQVVDRIESVTDTHRVQMKETEREYII